MRHERLRHKQVNLNDVSQTLAHRMPYSCVSLQYLTWIHFCVLTLKAMLTLLKTSGPADIIFKGPEHCLPWPKGSDCWTHGQAWPSETRKFKAIGLWFMIDTAEMKIAAGLLHGWKQVWPVWPRFRWLSRKGEILSTCMTGGWNWDENEFEDESDIKTTSHAEKAASSTPFINATIRIDRSRTFVKVSI